MNALEGIYGKAPVWAQNTMVSLRGAQFRFGRSNDAVIAAELQRLLKSERVTQEQRLVRLNLELRRYLRTAVETTPYYARRFAAGEFPAIWEADDPLSELSSLPLLEKDAVRGKEVQFHSTSVVGQRIVNGYTSGTTGSPMHTKETVVSLSRRFAFVARLRSWAGVPHPLHPRRVQFTGRQICQDTAPFWRFNTADNALLMSTVNITEESVPLYAEAMAKFRPDLMDGYPSAMLAVARLGSVLGIELPRVPVIITTAETLTGAMRAEIEGAFGGQVYNQYAASEPSCMWTDCEYGRMHVHQEYGVSEILDPSGAPVRAGDVGEVVVTSILNPAMPLIRYRTGDLARVSEVQECPCGRGLPLVGEVLGRQDDVLYTPSRGYVGRLDPVYKGLAGIVESQIVQESLTLVRVLVVQDGCNFDEAQRSKLVRNLKNKLGSDQEIGIQIVDRIPRGANGKFRAVVSACSSSYPYATRWGPAP